jgi:hypothetical protein
VLAIPLLRGLTTTVGAPRGEKGVGPYACGSKVVMCFNHQQPHISFPITPPCRFESWESQKRKRIKKKSQKKKAKKKMKCLAGRRRLVWFGRSPKTRCFPGSRGSSFPISHRDPLVGHWDTKFMSPSPSRHTQRFFPSSWALRAHPTRPARETPLLCSFYSTDSPSNTTRHTSTPSSSPLRFHTCNQ